MLARHRTRREVRRHTGVRHGRELRYVRMPKRKQKPPSQPKRVAKLPPDAEIDRDGPRLLPLPPDKQRKHETHPQIDSFVDLADAAMKLWDRKK